MSQNRPSPEIALEPRARLGEGPVWDHRTRSLYFVDALNQRVHQYFPERGNSRPFEIGDLVSSLAFTRGDKLLLAVKNGLVMLDTTTGGLTPLLELETDKPANKLNDGKCDARGRFWLGSFSKEQGEASLYRFDPDGTLHVMQTGLTGANGLGWSPDGRTFYLTDSGEKLIYAYDFDEDAGSIDHRRVLIDLSEADPIPDGLCVDTEGCLWSAQFGGGCVIRFDAEGRELERIELPAPQTTSCAFGGNELRTLYVTSAAAGLSEDELEEFLNSGDLFQIEMEVEGLPFHPFGG
jgi:sugar lactone lactonase YvrE